MISGTATCCECKQVFAFVNRRKAPICCPACAKVRVARQKREHAARRPKIHHLFGSVTGSRGASWEMAVRPAMDVAAELGITHQAVNYLEVRAFDKIRKAYKSLDRGGGFGGWILTPQQKDELSAWREYAETLERMQGDPEALAAAAAVRAEIDHLRRALTQI